MPRTAALLVIGNEILSGKVRDRNAYFLCTELRKLGVEVRRLVGILDEVETIGREVRALSVDHDFVFTSGGVGPTHDDVTMEGIAAGFGTRAVHHPRLEETLRKHYGDDVNEAKLRMALVPDGADLIEVEGLFYPMIVFRNVYIFPGVPEILEQKFMAIRERFRDQPYHLRRVYLQAGEGEIAETLQGVVDEHAGIDIGSYPTWNMKDYRVLVTVESLDEAELGRAFDALLKRLPDGSVVKSD